MGSKHHNNFAESKLDASPLIKSASTARQTDPAGARHSISPAQLEIAQERVGLLKSASPLFEGGLSQATVATLLGISPATLSRLLNLCPIKGNFARKALAKCRRLLRLPASRLAPKAASGRRKSDFASLLKVPGIVRELRRRYATHRSSRKPHSVCIRAAIQDLGYAECVPPLLARRLRIGSQPKPLVDLLQKSPCAGKARRRRDYSRN
jgi:hypothetical protein